MATITATEAYQAMLEHHKKLGEELVGRADAVSREVAARRPYGAAVASLVAYLAEEVLPHAAAEEKTIYPAAARAGLASTVEEMTAEHVTLSALGAQITALTDGEAAAGQARQIAGLFTAHAAKENDVLLPALLADKSADLAGLLAQMHDSTGHDEAPASAAGQPEDAPATAVSLLLQAAAALARAGGRTVPARSQRRRGPRRAVPGQTWRSR
jgi:iron-sulfur cluster repair protein YtfE (RIC family)